MRFNKSIIYAAAAISLGVGMLAPGTVVRNYDGPSAPKRKPKRAQADRSRKVHLIKGVRP